MKHRLIKGDGGEKWLPFAESCITKLKKLNLAHASQSFEIEGFSIKVRIEPGHEYIRIEGGLKILSGVIKGGEVVELLAPSDAPEGTLPTNVLRSFKPTENAWVHALNRRATELPSVFSDDKFLLRCREEAQWASLSPSMFSGLMAKAVAIVMGRGIKVEYDHKWSRCHGITLGSDGKPWLVEISAENGVIAMKLPMDRGKATSKVEAEKEIVALLGGVPNGRTFPTIDGLDAAIAVGTVVRLAEPAELKPYYDKMTFYHDMGWSFDNSGGVAQNTAFTSIVYQPTGGIQVSGYLYKLSISIATDDSAVATGSAVFSEVERGLIVAAYSDYARFRFPSVDVPATKFSETDGSAEMLYQTAPLYVCHIDGAFEVIRHTNTALSFGTLFYEEGSSQGVAYRENVTNWRNFERHSGSLGGDRVYSSKTTTMINPEAGMSRYEVLSSWKTSIPSDFEDATPGFISTVLYRRIAIPADALAARSGMCLFALSGCRDGYGAIPLSSGDEVILSVEGSYSSDGGPIYDDVLVAYPTEWADYPGIGAYGTQVDWDYGEQVGSVYQIHHSGVPSTTFDVLFEFDYKYVKGLVGLKVRIYSVYSEPIDLSDRPVSFDTSQNIVANRAGVDLMKHGEFRFSVFGVTNYAFTVKQYNITYYFYDAHIPGVAVTAGATYLSSDGVDNSSNVTVDVKYNFIGHIK